MNKVLNIIGAVLLVIAAVLGQFFNFKGDTIIEIALAAFALASIVIATIKDAKEKESLNWKTYLIIVLAIVGGILVCVGGSASSVITAIVGAAIALVAVILSLVTVSKK